MGLRAQRVLRRWVTMEQVYQYMATVLRAIASRQRAARVDYYVPSSAWFVPLDVSRCLRRRHGGARPSTDIFAESDVDVGAVECVGAKVSEALADGAKAVAAAARATGGSLSPTGRPLARPADWWQQG